jgi:citrate synthase
MNKTLFEIKEECLESGLRGVPVGYCTTSRVDPELGLFYRNKPVKELAHKRPEEVIYYLMEGDVPGFETFSKELQTRSFLHPKVKEHICKLPPDEAFGGGFDNYVDV